MAKIDKSELTREQIQKAMACETAEELMALAKAEGFDITKEEAEAYMDELADVELDEATLAKAAGGGVPREGVFRGSHKGTGAMAQIGKIVALRSGGRFANKHTFLAFFSKTI